MGKTLYFECAAGISGDMAVASLLDLGASEERLRRALASLPADGFEVRISRVRKAGLDACDFDVVLDVVHENHDHDMVYLHGGMGHAGDGSAPVDDGRAHAEERHRHDHGGCGRDHSHEHGHGCEHGRGHEHGHEGHHHASSQRNLAQIEAIIRGADMSDRAREIALRIFEIIARAEAKAHGVAIDRVHFHEVGAIDSIVDIVAFAVCFDDLGIEDVVVEGLCEGRGTVRCQHGVLPVPVPAVVNIVSEAGIPLSIMDVRGEFVTPTGAAMVAAVRTRAALPARFAVRRIGMGAGKRTYEIPGILRAMVIEAIDAPDPSEASSGADRIWKLECDVDDCTGEALGFVMGRLFAAGAREAHFVPVFMKKNRPAYQIQVICAEADISTMEHELFAHTTTIGVRRAPMERTVLAREEVTLSTPLGPARAKRTVLPTGGVRVVPEHDSVVALVESSPGGASLTYQDAYRLVERAAEEVRLDALD